MMKNKHNIVAFFESLNKTSRYACCFGLGALATFGFPPYSFILTPFISFLLFVTLLWSGKTKKQYFLSGWWFGFGLFSMSLTWLANAFFVDAQRYAILSPISFLGLGAILAFFPAIACFFNFFIKSKNYFKLVAFASLFAFCEWLRSWLFTGFPWNPVGIVWSEYISILQTVAYVGILGLSFFSVLFFCLPAVCFYKKQNSFAKNITISLFLCFVFFLSCSVYGKHRLNNNQPQYYNDIKIRVVQPNIPQKEKWQPSLLEKNFNEYIKLSKTNKNSDITHIIWGETASPFTLDKDITHLIKVLNIIPKNGGFITGYVRREKQKIYNSMIGITDEGKWFGTYDKSHLVPFGEYTPFKNILPLDKLTPGNTDFSKGSGLKTIKMPNLPPFSPLICYEVIFSANVKNKKDKPKWLLNLTNDGWYGLSTGPYQHFELSRLRAIEEGLPLVRVANTGISGLVDGTGRVLKVFPLNIKGNIDFKLVKNISNETLFLRHGNKIPLFLLTVFPFLVAILSREKPLIAQT